ncbi:MAG: tetratricopeptide repeat protein [Sedimentisphaerales bacterium]|nr:tetratricopeptide repeat protein [Sedimentisphaerales bacterium]
MDRNSEKNRTLFVCLALVIVTAAVYAQVCSFDFLKYDDHPYITGNENVKAGITLKTVKWAFTADNLVGNWHPLTWLSHALDWQLFGDDAAAHHINNLLFHIANTLLLFVVLKQMTSMLWPSAFAAVLFALHPLHVESVAWIAERKDVLSTFFWLLTMWAYVRFVRQPKAWRYLLVVVFFALGLMSKPMLVTLPFVLLLLDYWPLERITAKRSLVYLVIEKIPLFAMVAASSVVTFIVQNAGRTAPSDEGCGLVVRLANAPISYLKYIAKMFWPSRLAVFYPHPGENISFLFAAISAFLLLIITVAVLLFAKKHKYLFTGWFWYVGTLVPVIGIVQVGYQAMADRYTYVPLTGLFIIIAFGANELFAKWISACPSRQARRHPAELRSKKTVITVLILLIILAMSVCTSVQLRYWQNDLALFQHAIDVTENNHIAHFSVANVMYLQRKFDEAVAEYRKGLEIDPVNSEGLQILCDILIQQGKFSQAVKYLTDALRTKPDLHEVRFFFASVLVNTGDSGLANAEYEQFLKDNPESAIAHNDYAIILFRQGRSAEAVEHFNQAIQIDPDFELAKENLASVLAQMQKKNADSTKE